jgi:4'-phosphopantetheinyl transferase
MSRPAWVMVAAHDLPGSDAWLSPREQLVLSGHELPRRRGDWRLGRWAAKNSILAALDEPETMGLAEIEVLAAADGAPEASFRGSPAGISVSISHRDGVAVSLACPAGTLVGCDLELIEPRTRAFASDWFTPGELAIVEASPPEGRDRLVTMIWSAKESALKAVRQGLRLDTRDVEVRPSGESASVEEGWRRFSATYSGKQLAGWWRSEGRWVMTAVIDPAGDPPAGSANKVGNSKETVR